MLIIYHHKFKPEAVSGKGGDFPLPVLLDPTPKTFPPIRHDELGGWVMRGWNSLALTGGMSCCSGWSDEFCENSEFLLLLLLLEGVSKKNELNCLLSANALFVRFLRRGSFIKNALII